MSLSEQELAQLKEMQENQFDVDSYQFPPNVPQALQEEIKNDFKLSQEIQQYMIDIAIKMDKGEISGMTWDDLQKEVNRIVQEKYGIEYGMPLPTMFEINRRMILAPKVPMHHIAAIPRTDFEDELSQQIQLKIRNSWVMLGDKEVAIVDTEQGPYIFPRYMAGTRLRKLLDGLHLQAGSALSAEAELRAIESLKTRISENQFKLYVLCGCFAEESKRSGLHYFFRKGLPTLVCSFHTGYQDGYASGRVIAALCLHPMGYHAGSHVGIMCPTDEIICALLMMRENEHTFWKKSGQWSASDPRSGL